MLWVIVIIVILSVGLYLYNHQHQPLNKRKRHIKAAPPHISESTQQLAKKQYCSTKHPYHCVIFVHEKPCCQAALDIKHISYLSNEAPPIPLHECDMTQCNCHYQHKEDRRGSQENRRLDFGMTKDLYGAFGEKNRREKRRGRRESDRESQ